MTDDDYEPPLRFAWLRYALTTPLGRLCEWLAGRLERAGYRLIRCKHCGRSKFYGRGCVKR